MKILVKIWHLLILFFVLTLLSCTESGDEYCDPADRPYQKGMIDLLFSVSGQEEITPQTRHGAPTPGTADENSVTTLHVFIFNDTGGLETREVINIDAATGTATDAITGNPNPNWFGGDRRKLRVRMSPGDKTIAVVANWRTDGQEDPDMPPLINISTLSDLQAVERIHYEQPLPINPPVMCGVKYTNIDGSETDLPVNLERQIARIDFYPAISNPLKKLNVELKITGVKFNKVSGNSYLTYHTNGGTPPEPISPPHNPLWDLPDNAYTDTPRDVIDITDPAAPDAVKYATLYIPENIASGEEGATELIIRATYNGKETYYGVKLHNGKSDADKRFWVERNHFYRYNITITGIGSDDMKRPNWLNVQVGVSNDEWVGGESTSPGFGIELPQSEIEVVHFKGITRFELPGDYSVDSNVDWLSAHRIVEGNGENQRTYLEIMTRTNNSGSERMGEVTVLTRNGASSTMKVKQLTEATSLWRNPTDKTTWYRANIGAARIEDPGFFYQWGRNVAYSPYTPIPGIHVSLTDPLVSYGAVNWDETAEIFARDNPITTWDASAPPDSEWAVDKNPCPSGYLVPNSQQMVKLIGGIMFHDPALSVTSGFTQNPGWWFNGKAAITTGEGLFIRQYHAGRTPGTGYLRVEMGTYLQFRDFKGFAHLSKPSEWIVGPNSDPWGMSVRCVRSGNVLYDAGAPDATGTMTDSRFYEVGEEVLPLASTYTREGYRQSGWQVIGSNGNEMVRELPLAGTTFNFPTEADYVTLRAVWIKQFTNRWTDTGLLFATDTGDAGTEYVVPNAPPNPDPEWRIWGYWSVNAGNRPYPNPMREDIHPGEKFIYNSNLSWSAKWKWRVRYFSNGVEQTHLEQQGVAGTGFTVQQPPAPPSGYAFQHWSWSDTNGATGIRAPGERVGFGAGTKYDAVFYITKYTATFNSNGGTPSYADQTRNPGESWGSPGEPKREGYTFRGWSGSNNQALGSPASDNAVFTAVWEEGWDIYVNNEFYRKYKLSDLPITIRGLHTKPDHAHYMVVSYKARSTGRVVFLEGRTLDRGTHGEIRIDWVKKLLWVKEGWWYTEHELDLNGPLGSALSCASYAVTLGDFYASGWEDVPVEMMQNFFARTYDRPSGSEWYINERGAMLGSSWDPYPHYVTGMQAPPGMEAYTWSGNPSLPGNKVFRQIWLRPGELTKKKCRRRVDW